MTLTLAMDEIRGNLSAVLDGMRIRGVDFSVEPARPGFGDITSNVSFLLSGRLGEPPRKIAEDISGRYGDLGGRFVSGVEAHPSGHVNFRVDMAALGEATIRGSVEEGYGSVDLGRSARVVVEHTSVNPNKALHIGHVRNVVVGDTVARILRRANYDVSVLNYVDDSGLQVADIVLGFRRLGFPEEPPDGAKFDHYCGDEVYVKATAEYAGRPELERERREILREIEGGTSELAAFADSVTRRVLACQLQTCWNLSAEYDCLNYESGIIRSGLWGEIFEKLKSMGLVELEGAGKNAGCWVVRGGGGASGAGAGAGGAGGEDDMVLVRSNGTATYVAKDIPYAAWKLGLVGDPFGYERYGGARQPGGRELWQTTLGGAGTKKDFRGGRAITVIDSRQSNLQGMIAALMGKFSPSADAYVHLGYESVTLSPETAGELGIETGGRRAHMSGRRGLYVNADSVYGMLLERSAAESRKRNPGLPHGRIMEIARAVAVGTIRYEMIKQDLDKMISFDLARSLSLEGDTAPYIQYTHARASRILEKAGAEADLDADYSLLDGPHERDLVKQIGMLDGAVRDAASNLSPKVVARYCHDLAVLFNAFYEHVKVLDSGDAGLANARLCLVASFRAVLRNALSLLGIAAPDRM